ncbi:MAG: tetratricopeptide repeat protein [Chitinispirillaceae bacterium]
MPKNKKKKNNKKTATQVLRSMAPDQLQMYAEKNLGSGKLHVARDAYKQLVRLDESRYMPGLLHCYNLLAEHMAGKGQLTEAKNLITLIRDLGGESAVTADLGMFDEQGNRVDQAIVSVCRNLEQGVESPPDQKYRAADAAMAAHTLPDTLPATFLEDYRAIRSALETICSQDYDIALDQVKQVAFRSAFSQWKLLVRGMGAFYTGDDSAARKSFHKIDGETVPGNLARSYLTLIEKTDRSNKKNGRQTLWRNACICAGYAHLADTLSRAQYLWITGRRRDSFRHVIKNFKGFPTMEEGLTGELSLFYFNSFHHLSPREQDRYIDVFDSIMGLDRASRPRFKSKYTQAHYLAQRAMCNLFLQNPQSFEGDQIVDMWDHLYDIYKNLYGPDPDLESEINLIVGTGLLSGLQRKNMFDPFAADYKDFTRAALGCLKKAVTVNNSKDAYIALLNYYLLAGNKNEARRTIEAAVKFYPDDKDILFQAGLMAVSRDAVFKGIDYLEKAVALDPFDKQVRTHLILACVQGARLATTNTNPCPRIRRLMNRAEELCTDGSGGPNAEKRYMVMRKAALEYVTGNPKQGQKDLNRALGMPGNRTTIVYFGYFIFKIYGAGETHLSEYQEEIDSLFSSTKSIDRARELAEIIHYCHLLEPSLHGLKKETTRTLKYALDAVKIDSFTRDDIQLFLDCALMGSSKKLGREILHIAMSSHPGLPLYKFYAYKLKKTDPNSYSNRRLDKAMEDLEEIREEAQDCGDDETIALVQTELNELNEIATSRLGPAGSDLADLVEIFKQMGPPPFMDEDEMDEMDESFFEDDDPFYPPPARRKKPKNKRRPNKNRDADQIDLFGE